MTRATEKAETYQGWTNYETWAMHLWITNDEGSYRAAHEIVRDVLGEYHEDRLLGLSYAGDALKEWAEQGMPEVEGVWADLLNGAFSEINWREIAGVLVEE